MSVYKNYTPGQLENLFSQFLIDSWSYSKVTQFSRNEKAFEREYIFGERSSTSASTIAGQAYHKALDSYFGAIMSGADKMDLVTLELIAFEFIEEKPAYAWKLQKTTPTVEECISEALKTVTALLKNFMYEVSTYEDDIEEILDVEVYCDEWLTINGVDIPMPCHGKIDLVVRTKKGKIAIVDHKSKKSFSTEEEMKLGIGKQAITYDKLYKSKTGIDVDEVWFVENKYAKNKTGAKQLNNFKLDLDDNVRRLYEVLLYEPLKRLLEAVSDPDHTYIINDSDNFVDKAELYDFWARTLIMEVEDFNVADNKKELVAMRMRKNRDASIQNISPKVIKNFKQNASTFIQYDLSNKDMTPQQKIEHVLNTFGAPVMVSHMFEGYSSNTFLLKAGAGVKLSSIHNHRLDIANALNVTNVRIPKELTVFQGESYLPVDYSKAREKDLFFEPADLVDMKIPIGRDNYGNIIVWDLDNQSTPHMLVCGATGSGKSVSIKSTIEYAKLAGIEHIIIMDPKREFVSYKKDPKVRVLNEIIEIEEEMARQVIEMNDMVKSGSSKKRLIILEEFADAVASARSGKELEVKEMVQVGTYAAKKNMFGFYDEPEPKMKLQTTGQLKSLEENMRILVQKGRSVGFRVLSATQRASTKIITGDTKANFPVVVCFYVPKAIDSTVVLDEPGAESLAGKGDGLLKSPEYKDTVRFQAYYYNK